MSTLKFHPLTGKPIEPIGVLPNGRVVWPIMGGDNTVPPATPPAAGTPTPPATPSTPTVTTTTTIAPPPPASDRGFPDGTPLEQMTSEQQAAYWKHYARQHEQRVKDLGNLTPEQLAELRTKAEEHEKLQRESMTASEKAVDDAKAQARTEERGTFLPQLVMAEFKAAAAGRIDAEQLKAIVGPLDKSFFYAADGTSVDEAKVADYVNKIAPAQTTPPLRRGPSPAGVRTGNPTSGGGAPAANGLAAGEAAYQRRHGKRD